MAKHEHLRRAVQEILFRKWDPIGVNDNENLCDEYNNYATTLARALAAGADAYKLLALLFRFQRESMGLSNIDEKRDRHVVQLLLDLVSTKESGE